MNQWEGRTIEGWGRVGRGGVRREGRVEEREREALNGRWMERDGMEAEVGREFRAENFEKFLRGERLLQKSFS